MIGFALAENAWGVIIGTVGGMLLTPLLAGASPSELHTALLRPAK